MNGNQFNTKRIHWVDVAKGLLIILVAMGHLIQRGEELSISCPALSFIKNRFDWVSVFYMATFFMVSGFFIKPDVPFKEFVGKSAISLLLPLIVFSYIGDILYELCYEFLKHTCNPDALKWPSLRISIDYWFILVLFLSRVIFWGVCRFVKTLPIRWLSFLIIYFLGIALLSIEPLPNFAFWKWALIMAIYLPLGGALRKHLDNNWLVLTSVIIFTIIWLVFKVFGIDLPRTVGGMPNMDLIRSVPSLLLCSCGSCAFLKVCSLIKRSRLLEFIGRNTLAIYIMHWWVEILAMKVLRDFFSRGIVLSTIATILCIILAVFIPAMISELFNRPKLRWIIGKS